MCFRINWCIGPKLSIWGAQSSVGTNLVTCFLIQENMLYISIVPRGNKDMNKMCFWCLRWENTWWFIALQRLLLFQLLSLSWIKWSIIKWTSWKNSAAKRKTNFVMETQASSRWRWCRWRSLLWSLILFLCCQNYFKSTLHILGPELTYESCPVPCPTLR